MFLLHLIVHHGKNNQLVGAASAKHELEHEGAPAQLFRRHAFFDSVILRLITRRAVPYPLA